MTLTDRILRVFEVRARSGCVELLQEKLAHTSVSVVKGEPGNTGHCFGKLESSDGRDFVFISIWSDLQSIQDRFGDDWNSSFLPQGYEEIIESCSLKHFTVSGEID